MNKESLGKRFKNGNQEYECIAYTDRPTVVMENLETKERINVVIDSMIADEFEEIEKNNKITPQDVENLGYACNTFRKCFEKGWKKCEKDNKKIEKLPKWATTREDKEYTKQEEHILVVSKKLDEIIDKINKDDRK